MTLKSLGNPFSSKTDLRHGADCGCKTCASASEQVEDSVDLSTSDGMLERAVESAIVRSVFGQSDIGRRSFLFFEANEHRSKFDGRRVVRKLDAEKILAFFQGMHLHDAGSDGPPAAVEQTAGRDVGRAAHAEADRSIVPQAKSKHARIAGT